VSISSKHFTEITATSPSQHQRQLLAFYHRACLLTTVKLDWETRPANHSQRWLGEWEFRLWSIHNWQDEISDWLRAFDWHLDSSHNLCTSPLNAFYNDKQVRLNYWLQLWNCCPNSQSPEGASCDAAITNSLSQLLVSPSATACNYITSAAAANQLRHRDISLWSKDDISVWSTLRMLVWCSAFTVNVTRQLTVHLCQHFCTPDISSSSSSSTRCSKKRLSFLGCYKCNQCTRCSLLLVMCALSVCQSVCHVTQLGFTVQKWLNGCAGSSLTLVQQIPISITPFSWLLSLL